MAIITTPSIIAVTVTVKSEYEYGVNNISAILVYYFSFDASVTNKSLQFCLETMAFWQKLWLSWKFI